MSFRSSREFVSPAIAAALALVACTGGAIAQPRSSTAPMPFFRRTAGWLAADTTLAKVYLCRDLNGNGTFTDPGEVTVFFDGTNASGLVNGTTSMLSLYQAADGTVYIGSNNTTTGRTIYAVRDANLNGNAQDAGEARVFCDQTAAVPVTTPNGITGDANAIYVCMAGAGTATQDGLARYHDGNSNGNANDAGESSLFCDMSNLLLPVNSSSAFEMCQANGAFYFLDTRGSATDVIYRAADTSGNGTIEASELSVFINDGDFGVQLGFDCRTDGTSIYTHENLASATQNVYRLTDLDASGTINAATEAVMIWSEANLPAGEVMGNSFDFDVAPRALAISSNQTTPQANEIVLARDLDGNGLFTGPGETTVAIKNSPAGSFPQVIRSLIAYGWPCPADFNMSGGVTVQDLFDFLAAWFSNDPRADINGVNGVTVQDIFDFLAAWFSGC